MIYNVYPQLTIAATCPLAAFDHRVSFSLKYHVTRQSGQVVIEIRTQQLTNSTSD